MSDIDLQSILSKRSRVIEFQQRHRVRLLTLLFTDMVGSTQLKQDLGDDRAVRLILDHHSTVRGLLQGFTEAEEIGTAGDSFFIIFTRPSKAVRFALLLQQKVAQLSESSGITVQDRIGIHVGEVITEEDKDASRKQDMFGLQVDLSARIMSLAQGGQILLSRLAYDSAYQVISREPHLHSNPIVWMNHGRYVVKGLDEPIGIYEVRAEGSPALKPPFGSDKAYPETEYSGENSPETLKPRNLERQKRRRFVGVVFNFRIGLMLSLVAVASLYFHYLPNSDFSSSKVNEFITGVKEPVIVDPGTDIPPPPLLPPPKTLPSSIAVTLPGDLVMNFKLVQPGTFRMGSPPAELGRKEYESQSEATISEPFFIGVTEVTQDQYKAITNTNPSDNRFDGGKHPVERIRYNDLTEPDGFLPKFNRYSNSGGKGKWKAAELGNWIAIQPDKWEAALPTDAEWEFACRAGTETAIYNGKNLTNTFEDPLLPIPHPP